MAIRLSQLLQEEQQPFSLQNYLSERRYMEKKKMISSSADCNGWTAHQKRMATSNGSKILRLAINKMNSFFKTKQIEKPKMQHKPAVARYMEESSQQLKPVTVTEELPSDDEGKQIPRKLGKQNEGELLEQTVVTEQRKGVISKRDLKQDDKCFKAKLQLLQVHCVEDVNQLMNVDVCDATKEWTNFQLLMVKEDIGKEIADVCVCPNLARFSV